MSRIRGETSNCLIFGETQIIPRHQWEIFQKDSVCFLSSESHFESGLSHLEFQYLVTKQKIFYSEFCGQKKFQMKFDKNILPIALVTITSFQQNSSEKLFSKFIFLSENIVFWSSFWRTCALRNQRGFSGGFL